ncbi:MAG: toxin-antitoxin system YwqK family antitoxin, partial [Bacteroidota bacterium]
KYSNGITNMRGFFRFGKKHGRWASFFPSGQLQSETQFDNGIRTGKACVWYTNGKVMYEGEYKNDVKTGEWKSYDTSGVLIDTKKY